MAQGQSPKLFPHQIEAISFLKDKPRYLLSDEQGCGKSAVGLHVAVAKGAKNILVLCPKSVVGAWQLEAEKWFPGCFNFELGQDSVCKNPRAPRLVIMNWDKLIQPAYIGYLEVQQWDFVIGDETHKAIKNWKAKRCKNFIFTVLPHASEFLLMTGTPITRSAMDLHPTLSILLPGRMGKFGAFCEKYCNKDYHGYGYRGFSYSGFKNETELHSILSSVMLRRTKEEVLPDLPEKIFKEVPIDVSDAHLSKLLDSDIDIVRACIEAGTLLPGPIMEVMHKIGLAKLEMGAEYISDLAESGPVGVFATHKKVIEGLRELLERDGHRVGVINGEVGQDERNKVVEDFQNGKLDVFIGNYAAAAEGITLTRASQVVTLEYPWSPATLEQAIDRFHRIGQKNCVLIHNLVAKGSLDSVVLDSLQRKSLGIDKTINGSFNEEALL